MKARAVQGAKRLASAVVSGDQQSLHQFRQTSDLLQLWKLADADALISENQAQRTIVLAAIELGSKHPLLRTAYRVEPQAAELEHEGSAQLDLCHPRERSMRHDVQLKNSALTLIDMHFCSALKKSCRPKRLAEGLRSLWKYPK